MLRLFAILAVLIPSLLCLVSEPVRGALLFRADFSGDHLNTDTWNVGTWRLGRTQLDGRPQVDHGYATLRFQTYNPADPGGSFRGQEIYTEQTFSRGDGLVLRARVRVHDMPDGLVTSFFTYARDRGDTDYNGDGEDDFYADEIDFEFLSNKINASATSDPFSLTAWDDWNASDPNASFDDGVHHISRTVEKGIELSEWNVLKIHWTPDGVSWFVNDQRLWSESKVVPDLQTHVRFNFWAPAASWGEAYSAALEPADNRAANQVFRYDIDWVEVRRQEASPPQSVPTPSAAWGGLVLLGLLTLRYRKRCSRTGA